MSPILVRPVREQLEHDKVIRLLQAKYKRKFEVGINPGAQQLAAVGSGSDAVYPDLVLHLQERSRRLAGVVEVETSESVNHLEAMSQWGNLAKLRVAFHLYVPAVSLDTARRLCHDYNIPVTEVWAYVSVGDQIRFTQISRMDPPPLPKQEPAAKAERAPASKPANRRVAPPARRSVQKARVTAARPSGAASARPAKGKAKKAVKSSRAARPAQKRK